jgi:hypothetical protein
LTDKDADEGRRLCSKIKEKSPNVDLAYATLDVTGACRRRLLDSALTRLIALFQTKKRSAGLFGHSRRASSG